MTRRAVKALEFYSGIGGMHYALQRACPGAVVLDAFDINHAANEVYAHNFGRRPKQVDLASMSAADLDAYAADLWLMAPPCQPFTRQGKQRGGADARSSSFLHLMQQLQLMQAQPSGLLVENVVGFQGSDVHTQLAAALTECGYHTQEFMLTPTQYGVPYSRPRYFCVASKQPLPVPVPDLQQPCLCTPAVLLQLQHQRAEAAEFQAAAQQMASHVQQVPTLGEYLSLPLLGPVQESHQQQAAASRQGQSAVRHHQQAPQQQDQHCLKQQQLGQHTRPLSQQAAHPLPLSTSPPAGADSMMDRWVYLPDKVLDKYADVVDVASWSSRSCNCFTKAYAHFARGTGSMLATVADPGAINHKWQLVAGSGSLELRGYTRPAQRNSSKPLGLGQASAAAIDAACSRGGGVSRAEEVGDDSSESLAAAWKQLQPRYFTVREISQLHSFPDSFRLPAGFSSRQGYQLLGNSLSVAVVADLLAYLGLSLVPQQVEVESQPLRLARVT